jgi:hypothetical protein
LLSPAYLSAIPSANQSRISASYFFFRALESGRLRPAVLPIISARTPTVRRPLSASQESVHWPERKFELDSLHAENPERSPTDSGSLLVEERPFMAAKGSRQDRFLAPQARGPRRALRVAGWRPGPPPGSPTRASRGGVGHQGSRLARFWQAEMGDARFAWRGGGALGCARWKNGPLGP